MPRAIDSSLRTEHDLESNHRKILLLLSKANSPAPSGYISLHSGIREPLDLLRRMGDRGLVEHRVCLQHGPAAKILVIEIRSAVRERLYGLLS